MNGSQRMRVFVCDCTFHISDGISPQKNHSQQLRFGVGSIEAELLPSSLFKTLLGQYNLKQGSHACDWGILHEPKAKQEYMERTGVTIQERGVFLSDSGLLGGSPDGTVVMTSS
ncbi:unnamed protein product [Boreogadus saida]